MPEAPKTRHLSTVVQSELFDTDIEKLSAQGDDRRALSNPPDPPGARAGTCVQDPARTLACGGLGIFERQPDMSNLAQSSAQEAAFITNGRGYPAVSDCRYHVRYVAEGEARRSA